MAKAKESKTPSKTKSPPPAEDPATPTAPKKRRAKQSLDETTQQLVRLLHLMILQKGGPADINWTKIGEDLNEDERVLPGAARMRYVRSKDEVVGKSVPAAAVDGDEEAVEGAESAEKQTPSKKKPAKEKPAKQKPRKKRKIMSEKTVDDDDELEEDREEDTQAIYDTQKSVEAPLTAKAQPNEVEEPATPKESEAKVDEKSGDEDA